MPTFLVFGAFPRLELPTDTLAFSKFKRATALKKAALAMSKIFASRQVWKALKTKNKPDGVNAYRTQIGFPIFVYRPEKDMWEGPCSLLNTSGEGITIWTSKERTKFCSTVIKQHRTGSTESSIGISIERQSENTTEHNSPHARRTSTSNFDSSPAHVRSFEITQTLEFNGVMDPDVYTLVPVSGSNRHFVYGPWLVNSIKSVRNLYRLKRTD